MTEIEAPYDLLKQMLAAAHGEHENVHEKLVAILAAVRAYDAAVAEAPAKPTPPVWSDPAPPKGDSISPRLFCKDGPWGYDN